MSVTFVVSQLRRPEMIERLVQPLNTPCRLVAWEMSMLPT